MLLLLLLLIIIIIIIIVVVVVVVVEVVEVVVVVVASPAASRRSFSTASSQVCPACRPHAAATSILAIFYPFSQLFEIGIFLPSLQKQPKNSPESISEGVEYGKYDLRRQLEACQHRLGRTGEPAEKWLWRPISASK